MRWGALAVSLAGVLYVASSVGGIKDGIAQLASKPRASWVQTFHVVWTDTNGDPCDVTVTGEQGEAPSQTAARFEAAVKELQVLHPKRR